MNSFVPCNEMPDIIHNYNTDHRSLLRFYTIKNSPEKRERIGVLLEDYKVRLQKIDFDRLSQECKADYILFKRDLEIELYSLGQEKMEYEALAQWFPFADRIYQIEKLRRRGGVPDSKKIAAEYFEITDHIHKLQSKLMESETLEAATVSGAVQTIEGLKQALASAFEFYNGYDPLFTWWVPLP